MSYRSLAHFVQCLESAGELIRIGEFVSPRLEITEVADRMVKAGGKALLFENTGTEFPLLINAMASDRRICMALGVSDLRNIEASMSGLLRDFTGPRSTFIEKLKILPALQTVSSWMPRSVSGRGACQEIVMNPPDLRKLPVLTCWPYDGGPFITLPGVHTRCPQTGARNLGMYRMQVFDSTLTGMHWHLHKGSANHFRQYRELGRKMPVTVTLGGDPAYIYAATAPLPENLDEYLLAGFLRRKRVDLVRCLTNDLEVPADVDFVIEGYVDPSEDLILEGPFGDHTGFYSLADYFPGFHVTCITHRRNAIYPATIVGVPPQEDAWIGKATEKIFLLPIRMTAVPELSDMHMPAEGVFHNIALTSIHKEYPGQAPKVMNAVWGAGQMMFNKVMAVTDSDVDLHDYVTLAKVISEKVDPLGDVHFSRGPVDILDHSSSVYAYGSKIGLDATSKLAPVQIASDPVADKPSVDKAALKSEFPEIVGIRDDFLEAGISLVICSVRKSRKNHLRQIAERMIQNDRIQHVKFVVLTDDQADLTNLRQLTWLVANNIDPVRDCFVLDRNPGEKFPTLWIDGTCKDPELDGFSREWPNIVAMDPQTIRSVDEKWNSLNLGPLIPSPSAMLQTLVNSPGAISKRP